MNHPKYNFHPNSDTWRRRESYVDGIIPGILDLSPLSKPKELALKKSFFLYKKNNDQLELSIPDEATIKEMNHGLKAELKTNQIPTTKIVSEIEENSMRSETERDLEIILNQEKHKRDTKLKERFSKKIEGNSINKDLSKRLLKASSVIMRPISIDRKSTPNNQLNHRASSRIQFTDRHDINPLFSAQEEGDEENSNNIPSIEDHQTPVIISKNVNNSIMELNNGHKSPPLSPHRRKVRSSLATPVFSPLPPPPHKLSENLIQKYYVTAFILEFIQVTLSLFSCLLYILDTYYNPSYNPSEAGADAGHASAVPHYIHLAEIVITGIFTADYVLHFASSHSKLLFFFKLERIVDLVAILPVYLAFFVEVEGGLGFLHVLQIFRLIRIFRVVRLFKEDRDHMGEERGRQDGLFEFYKSVAILVFYIVSVLFMYSGLMIELDSMFRYIFYQENTKKIIYPVTINDEFKQGYNYTFFDGFYFLIELLFTLGFRDLYPITSISRILICAYIFTLLFTGIIQGNKVYSAYNRFIRYEKALKHKGHFVVMGTIEDEKLIAFLHHLLNFNALNNTSRSIVVVRDHSNPPSPELTHILSTVFYQEKVNVLIANNFATSVKKSAILDCEVLFLFSTISNLRNTADSETLLLSNLLHQ